MKFVIFLSFLISSLRDLVHGVVEISKYLITSISSNNNFALSCSTFHGLSKCHLFFLSSHVLHVVSMLSLSTGFLNKSSRLSFGNLESSLSILVNDVDLCVRKDFLRIEIGIGLLVNDCCFSLSSNFSQCPNIISINNSNILLFIG